MTKPMFKLISFATLAWIGTTLSAAHAHDAPFNTSSIDVCESKQIRDKCEYKNAAEDVFKGHCLQIVDTVRCVRNQPIERSGKKVEPHQH